MFEAMFMSEGQFEKAYDVVIESINEPLRSEATWGTSKRAQQAMRDVKPMPRRAPV